MCYPPHLCNGRRPSSVGLCALQSSSRSTSHLSSSTALMAGTAQPSCQLWQCSCSIPTTEPSEAWRYVGEGQCVLGHVGSTCMLCSVCLSKGYRHMNSCGGCPASLLCIGAYWKGVAVIWAQIQSGTPCMWGDVRREWTVIYDSTHSQGDLGITCWVE